MAQTEKSWSPVPQKHSPTPQAQLKGQKQPGELKIGLSLLSGRPSHLSTFLVDQAYHLITHQQGEQVPPTTTSSSKPTGITKKPQMSIRPISSPPGDKDALPSHHENRSSGRKHVPLNHCEHASRSQRGLPFSHNKPTVTCQCTCPMRGNIQES